MILQRQRRRGWSVFAGCVLLAAAPALSGPPYVTDDPEPVPLHHWEFYLAATRTTDGFDRAGDAPHFEVNVGFVADLGKSHHVLFSAGRAVHGCDCTQGFVAYLLTLGPGP